jgi:hypothetical protein
MGLNHSPSIVTEGLVMCLDAGNPKSYSVNAIPKPVDIFGWCGGAGLNNCSISRVSIAPAGLSPAGGTPLQMNITGNDPIVGCYNSAFWNLAPAVAGQTWTISAYVSASQVTTGEFLLFGADATGNAFAPNTWIAGATINISTNWTRVSFTATIPGTATATAFIQCRLDGTNSGGSGITIWWDGLQIERSGEVTTFDSIPNLNNNNWYNASGSVNNGTLVNGPTYTTPNGGALVFNGTNNYASVTNSASLQFGETFSVSAWVYPTNLSARQGIFSTRTANASGSWQLELGTGNGGTNRISVTGVGTWIWDSNDNVISANNFYNITYVKPNNATQGGSLYLNGVLLSPLTTTAYTILNNSDAKSIGVGTSGTQFFPGNIYFVSVYNRALSGNEVLQNFNALKGRYGL